MTLGTSSSHFVPCLQNIRRRATDNSCIRDKSYQSSVASAMSRIPIRRRRVIRESLRHRAEDLPSRDGGPRSVPFLRVGEFHQR